jgi:hypothetical protein
MCMRPLQVYNQIWYGENLWEVIKQDIVEPLITDTLINEHLQ